MNKEIIFGEYDFGIMGTFGFNFGINKFKINL